MFKKLSQKDHDLTLETTSCDKVLFDLQFCCTRPTLDYCLGEGKKTPFNFTNFQTIAL